ncbi:MAG TPA: glycoside hydrolase family 3 N-terminal domain-containing protein [Acidimicrobiia bacterium]|nr:glycoside hydrolase family 3 N-terminal domain-containing protein [Acidimicrobiia bacterium]
MGKIRVALVAGIFVSGVLGTHLAAAVETGVPLQNAECSTRVDQLLAQMTNAEKVGQMVMVLNAPGFGDFTDTIGLIRDHQVGSVISHAYFGFGVADAASYNNSLQEAAASTRLEIPILNAADFEAGVSILVADGTSLPTQMGLAAARRPLDTRTAAAVTAAEALALGFNWSFSPLADVLTTPLNGEGGVRTFGGKSNLTSRLVAAEVLTFQRSGLIATAKHFPGMGGSEVNSHFGLPVVAYDRTTLQRTHLPPFESAIRAGVETIMTGHIIVETLDPQLPASLSPIVTNDLLREELGFDGVVVTDSMTLGAILGRWDVDEAAVLAVKAGADIVMEIGPTDLAVFAINALLSAVDGGEITTARLDESVRRVLSLKCRYGLLDLALVNVSAAESVVGSENSLASAAELSLRGVTLVRNRGVLPFDSSAGTTLVAGVTHPTNEVIPMPPASHVPTLAAMVEEVSEGSVLSWTAETESPTAPEIDAAVSLAADADRIIVATYSAGPLPAEQTRLVEALLATGKPLVAIATGTPYDLTEYSEVDAYVTAPALTFLPGYAFSQSLLEASIAVVFGAEPYGRLPVPIEGLYPLGHGMGYQGSEVNVAEEGD